MTIDKFTAWVQAVLSTVYLVFTFTIILIYELGFAKLTNAGQEKTFDSMVNWMTGGALIVLYFWLQRAKAQSDTSTTITTTTPPPPEPATTTVITAPVTPPKDEK